MTPPNFRQPPDAIGRIWPCKSTGIWPLRNIAGHFYLVPDEDYDDRRFTNDAIRKRLSLCARSAAKLFAASAVAIKLLLITAEAGISIGRAGAEIVIVTAVCREYVHWGGGTPTYLNKSANQPARCCCVQCRCGSRSPRNRTGCTRYAPAVATATRRKLKRYQQIG